MKTSIPKFSEQAKLAKSDDKYEVYDLSLEKLVISMTVLHPNKATTGHSHNTEEIYLFVKGKGEIQLGDKKQAVTKGDIILIPSKVFHRVFNLGSSDFVFLSFFEKYLGRGKQEPITVCVSGGFDPVHYGHVKHIREAKKLGDKLVVILSRDDQLVKKKGYSFMHLAERKEILEALRDVDEVVISIDKEITSNETLELIKPSIFAKGGDRDMDNMPEIELQVCDKIGCKLVYGVGGEKVQSSSSLARPLTK